MNRWHPQTDWLRLFPAEDFRFRMGLRTGVARDFFSPSADSEAVLRERRHWLTTQPDRYRSLTGEGLALLNEFAEWLDSGGSQVSAAPAVIADADLPSARARLVALASRWEPDFVLLSPATGGGMRVVGGAVCFPSSWALEEKLGQTLAEVHGPVPGLNARLGSQIDAALSRLPAGVGWLRENWGLAADAELNRHPARALAPLGERASLATTWLRLEHQVLLRLPASSGLAFGIRVTIHPLAEVVRTPAVRAAFARALISMPAEVAAYKGLAAARAGLVAQLQRDAAS